MEYLVNVGLWITGKKNNQYLKIDVLCTCPGWVCGKVEKFNERHKIPMEYVFKREKEDGRKSEPKERH